MNIGDKAVALTTLWITDEADKQDLKDEEGVVVSFSNKGLVDVMFKRGLAPGCEIGRHVSYSPEYLKSPLYKALK